MDNWLNKMERKFGRYAIPNLMRYIIVLYAAGFIIDYIRPELYYNYLSLDVDAILHGQVWRVITFIIDPPSTSLIWIIVSLSLYYFIGTQLEATWGAFKFNMYYFMGVFFHVIAAFLVYFIAGENLIYIDTTYLNLSLFMIFAAIYPDIQFMLYFVIPVKGKWLAILDGAFFLWAIIQAFLPAYGGNAYYGLYYRANAIAAFVSMLNFLLFFLSSRNMRRFSPKQQKRRKDFYKNAQMGQRTNTSYANDAHHRCAVCGRTDVDHPELEFRYCSKCNGNYEYCNDHLFTHQHVK